ncbi:hypothetical protein QJQ45_016139 [Haematococcus lacustris]|nr:hypothetical protein QJQ45_016139 [Haematococcus lacustris]
MRLPMRHRLVLPSSMEPMDSLTSGCTTTQQSPLSNASSFGTSGTRSPQSSLAKLSVAFGTPEAQTLAQDFQPGYNLSDIVSCTKHMLEASRPHTCKSLKSSVPRKTSVTATGHMPTELLDFHEIFDLKFIGSGASGSVFRGQWQGATVAVKLIVTTADRLHMSEAAANEAVLSCLLSHPTVVQTFSCKLLALTEPLLEYIARCTGHNTDTEAETGSLDASFASGEGFGNPLVESHNLAVIQEVLQQANAWPGSLLTQIVMEHCDKGNLLQAIERGLFKPTERWGPRLALRALLRTAREIAQGMLHIHQSDVVHGDLKPGNVLLKCARTDRRGFTAKVADFGLSRFTNEPLMDSACWATVEYMSPESFDGIVSRAMDVWAFGVTLWQMVTGDRPHQGLQPAQIMLGVQGGNLVLEWPDSTNARLVALGRSCLAHNSSARPSFKHIISEVSMIESEVRLERGPDSPGRFSLSGSIPSLSPRQAISCSLAPSHSSLSPAPPALCGTAHACIGSLTPVRTSSWVPPASIPLLSPTHTAWPGLLPRASSAAWPACSPALDVSQTLPQAVSHCSASATSQGHHSLTNLAPSLLLPAAYAPPLRGTHPISLDTSPPQGNPLAALPTTQPRSSQIWPPGLEQIAGSEVRGGESASLRPMISSVLSPYLPEVLTVASTDGGGSMPSFDLSRLCSVAEVAVAAVQVTAAAMALGTTATGMGWPSGDLCTAGPEEAPFSLRFKALTCSPAPTPLLWNEAVKRKCSLLTARAPATTIASGQFCPATWSAPQLGLPPSALRDTAMEGGGRCLTLWEWPSFDRQIIMQAASSVMGSVLPATQPLASS